jgi:hypothetical protein
VQLYKCTIAGAKPRGSERKQEKIQGEKGTKMQKKKLQSTRERFAELK